MPTPRVGLSGLDEQLAPDKSVIDVPVGEGGVAEDALVEGGGSLDAFDSELIQRSLHAGDGVAWLYCA